MFRFYYMPECVLLYASSLGGESPARRASRGAPRLRGRGRATGLIMVIMIATIVLG